MTSYEQYAYREMLSWQKEMKRKAGIGEKLSKKLQVKINSFIPEKVHQAITTAFEHMVRAVLTGAKFITSSPYEHANLEIRDVRAKDKITIYKNTAAAEGAITGAGGILLGLADFPAWLALKMKMMFDIAAVYGHDVKDYKERLYILYVFQLAFSGKEYRRNIFDIVHDWPNYSQTLPQDMDQYDWRGFQQEYRDYLDLAKLLQLVPGIGAVVGGIVNHHMTEKLGNIAMNAYRMRHFEENT